MDFGDWIDLLNAEAVSYGFTSHKASELSEIEDFLDLYFQDLTPFEALYEIAIEGVEQMESSNG